MEHLVRIELTNNGRLAKLVNHYNTWSAQGQVSSWLNSKDFCKMMANSILNTFFYIVNNNLWASLFSLHPNFLKEEKELAKSSGLTVFLNVICKVVKKTNKQKKTKTKNLKSLWNCDVDLKRFFLKIQRNKRN